MVIEDLIPYLRHGYVAMNSNGYWCWFETEPICIENMGFWHSLKIQINLNCFCIIPVEDWTQSLRKVAK